IEWRHHLPVGIYAFVQLVAVPALDQRLRLDPTHIVMIFAVSALDKGNVAKALGCHVGQNGALALQNSIGGHRRADPQIFDRLLSGILRETADDAGHWIAWR